MSDIEQFSGPESSPVGPEISQDTKGPESAAEEFPATLTTRRDVVDGAFGLTQELQEEGSSLGDRQKQRIIVAGQSMARITETTHDAQALTKLAKHLRPEAHQTEPPATIGKIEMVLGRPDGSQLVYVYDLTGTKEDPQINKSSLELSKDQVEKGANYNLATYLDEVSSLIKAEVDQAIQEQGNHSFGVEPDMDSDAVRKAGSMRFPDTDGPISEAEAKRLIEALDQLYRRA